MSLYRYTGKHWPDTLPKEELIVKYGLHCSISEQTREPVCWVYIFMNHIPIFNCNPEFFIDNFKSMRHE